MKRQGKIRVHLDELAKILRLPKDHHINHVEYSGINWERGEVVLYIRGPQMPEVLEGTLIPFVEYRMNDDTITKTEGTFV